MEFLPTTDTNSNAGAIVVWSPGGSVGHACPPHHRLLPPLLPPSVPWLWAPHMWLPCLPALTSIQSPPCRAVAESSFLVSAERYSKARGFCDSSHRPPIKNVLLAARV